MPVGNAVCTLHFYATGACVFRLPMSESVYADFEVERSNVKVSAGPHVIV